jgi:hypothetical protein
VGEFVPNPDRPGDWYIRLAPPEELPPKLAAKERARLAALQPAGVPSIHHL